MPQKKSRVEKSSNVPDAILDATERIMLEEGYAAVSSRRVARSAGLKSQLLHYYFRTMDDLFIAVFQRMEEAHDECFARAVASEQPIRELWKLSTDAGSASLIYEFRALATHRKTVKVLMARSAKRDRRMHVAALSRLTEQRPQTSEGLSPMICALLMASVARTLVTETALGVSDGHAEMLKFVERNLSRMDNPTRGRTSATHFEPGTASRARVPSRSGKRVPRKRPK